MWRCPGPSGWYFVTLPPAVADVRARSAARAKPFGSVRVQVTIGSTTWATSLFADTKSASYLVPVKGPVRRREGIADADTVMLTIALSA